MNASDPHRIPNRGRASDRPRAPLAARPRPGAGFILTVVSAILPALPEVAASGGRSASASAPSLPAGLSFADPSRR